MKALIIMNPSAGSTHENLEAQLQQGLEEWGGEVYVTKAPGDGEKRARQGAAEGVPMVVAVGGDDTVREVIAGIFGSTSTLGIIPAGTFNDTAASLQIPLEIGAAIEVIKSGETIRMDVGQLQDGSIFTETMGIGFDTAAFQALPSTEAKGFGRWIAGVKAAVQTLLQYNPKALRLRIDGVQQEILAMEVLIANTPFTGARMRVAPHASVEDGELDVCVIPAISKLKWCLCVPLMFSGQYLRFFPQVQYWQAKEISISSRRALPVRVDNGVTHKLPLTIKVLKGALPVIVPALRKEQPQPPFTSRVDRVEYLHHRSRPQTS